MKYIVRDTEGNQHELTEAQLERALFYKQRELNALVYEHLPYKCACGMSVSKPDNCRFCNADTYTGETDEAREAERLFSSALQEWQNVRKKLV